MANTTGKKFGGRKAGTPNRSTNELRTLITAFLDENFEQVKEDLEQLEPKDRVKFYIDLLSFGLPRLQSQQIEHAINEEKFNIINLGAGEKPPDE